MLSRLTAALKRSPKPTRQLDRSAPVKEASAARHGTSEARRNPGALVWCLGQPPMEAPPSLGVTAAPNKIDDDALVQRVQTAYRAACETYETSASFWDTTIGEIRRPIHETLSAPQPATKLLRDPANNAHFWGFDAVCKAPPGEIEPHERVMRALNDEVDWRELYAAWLQDAVLNLSTAVGASRQFYPETEPGVFHQMYGSSFDIDRLLDGIEARIGQEIRFPNPYPGELGLESRRGIASFRSLQALYQAWRLTQLAEGRKNFRVLEIGAGLGRTAYFAIQFGISDYTIIDIPLTNAAQGYFLGRTLGEKQVALFGETSSAPVRVLPPQAIDELPGRFDLVLNVDSFTEMEQSTALDYWQFVREKSSAFLSINHELNPHPVNTMFKDEHSLKCTRFPYWMRRGYVEEYVSSVG